MPVRDPDHRVLCSSWILNDHLCCCIHVPVPEKSHPYTNKKCVFSLLFTFFSQFKALIIFARERKDNNLADFSQCWVLTKSKYSPTFCRQCLLSWEENGKLFFTAFWKKKMEKKIWIFTYFVWSLLVLVLTFWQMLKLQLSILTQKSLSYIKSSFTHNFIGTKWTLFFFLFLLFFTK